ncbi:MAG: Uma2 family endonuclease [Gemmatimonadetes bacterium]|nr:Uma2 family endonuclease [Gemmatimonadota bacterium]
MKARDKLLTAEEFERLPDDGYRTELVRGRVVREPPAGYEHGRIGGELIYVLNRFVREHRLGEVLASETGFVLFHDPDTVRAPDAAFVAASRIPSDPKGFAQLAPDLAVEVVSPSNTWSEVQDKVFDYLDAGTRLVWVLEPRRRRIRVFRSRDDVTILGEDDVLEGADVLPGFRVPVRGLFSRDS